MSHLSEACRKMALSDWHLRLRQEEADALRAAYEQAMKVVEVARRWNAARFSEDVLQRDHDEAWELRAALREFEEGEKK